MLESNQRSPAYETGELPLLYRPNIKSKKAYKDIIVSDDNLILQLLSFKKI